MLWPGDVVTDASCKCCWSLLRCRESVHEVRFRPLLVVYPLFKPPMTHQHVSQVANRLSMGLQCPQTIQVLASLISQAQGILGVGVYFSFMSFYTTRIWLSCLLKAGWGRTTGKRTAAAQSLLRLTNPIRQRVYVSVWAMKFANYRLNDNKQAGS